MPARRAAAAAPPRPDRKSAILLAAEKLFAQHGYDAVSLRRIADEARVPLALVGYYYGQKHELFEAVFAHWQGTIQERLDGLRRALAAPARERLARIVEAFTQPVLRLRASAEGEYYARMVARELFHARGHTDRVLREFFDPLAHAFIDALHGAMPGASRADVAWCYQFMLGALLHHISDDRVQRLSRGQCRPADPAVAPMLDRFILGGIQAAAPRSTPSGDPHESSRIPTLAAARGIRPRLRHRRPGAAGDQAHRRGRPPAHLPVGEDAR